LNTTNQGGAGAVNQSAGRLPLIGDETTDETLQRVYARLRPSLPDLSHLYRTLGHAPDLLEAWLGFAGALRNAQSSRALRELLIMRTAQLSGSDYQWYPHWTMAQQAGVEEPKLMALSGWRESDVYTSAERSVLGLADELTTSGRLSDEAWAALRSEFHERELLELVMTCAWYVCVGRVVAGLQVPLDGGYVGVPAP
jgi:4-carboxymuconolactone decarboxylase